MLNFQLTSIPGSGFSMVVERKKKEKKGKIRGFHSPSWSWGWRLWLRLTNNKIKCNSLLLNLQAFNCKFFFLHKYIAQLFARTIVYKKASMSLKIVPFLKNLNIKSYSNYSGHRNGILKRALPLLYKIM